jgi:outer membrane protein
MKKVIFILFYIVVLQSYIGAQELFTYNLEQLISKAQSNSIASLKASTLKENSLWKYNMFKSNYRPQLILNATLPHFQNTYSETLQPDGSVQFQKISNSNTGLSLSISQVLTPTGGTIFIGSEIQRYDDFQNDFSLYNNRPVQFGIVQPLFQYNPYKWEKKIEPLKFEESLRQYFEEIEGIGLITTQLYFNVLISQIDFNIAETNLKNADTLLTVSRKRFELGRISQNDILQLELTKLNAQKSLSRASTELEIAKLNLRSYLSIEAEQFKLLIPESVIDVHIPFQLALDNALANRKNPLSNEIRLKEAEKLIAEAKGETGIAVNLMASVGYSNSASNMDLIYVNPIDHQDVQLSLTIPILDWGRSKAKLETAIANQKLVTLEIEQAEKDFNNEITSQVEQYALNQQLVEFTADADSIANKRYEIAYQRYLINNISITEYIMALNEKDQARKDFIYALNQYWISFQKIKYLTLYDFINNRKIEY